MATMDLDQLRLMTSGDAELAAEALAIFRSQADLWGRMLDGGGDRKTWTDACHTIKGAARSVGAMELGDACARAEDLGKSADSSSARDGVALSEVKDRLGEAIEAIASLEHQLLLTRSFDKLRTPEV
jgi:HPt (histidine-containing phosphotransfer) domain-containing protein